MRANQLRLWFASFAYVLICALRRIGLAHTQFADATSRHDPAEALQDRRAGQSQRPPHPLRAGLRLPLRRRMAPRRRPPRQRLPSSEASPQRQTQRGANPRPTGDQNQIKSKRRAPAAQPMRSLSNITPLRHSESRLRAKATVRNAGSAFDLSRNGAPRRGPRPMHAFPLDKMRRNDDLHGLRRRLCAGRGAIGQTISASPNLVPIAVQSVTNARERRSEHLPRLSGRKAEHRNFRWPASGRLQKSPIQANGLQRLGNQHCRGLRAQRQQDACGLVPAALAGVGASRRCGAQIRGQLAPRSGER